jgi:hypothetical protein
VAEQNTHDLDLVRASLNRHGYGFQFAVIRECLRLRDKGSSSWSVDATEFPVDVKNTMLHVDVVLRNSNAVIAVECKRVNPAMGIWVFGKSALAERREGESTQVVLQRLERQGTDGAFISPRAPTSSAHQYHVGIEIRTRDQKGDAQGGRGAWDDAVTQALRGATGIVHAVADEPNLFGRFDSMVVIPAIITTARLLACETDLGDASLDTGELPAELQVNSRPWLWFRVFASANVRPAKPVRVANLVPPLPSEHQFGELAASVFARSVAVVSANGLEEFLCSTSVQHVGGGLW